MQITAATQPIGPAQVAPAANAAKAEDAAKSEAAAPAARTPAIAPPAAALLEPASFGSLLGGQEAAFAAVLGNGPGDWSYETLVAQLGNAYGSDTAPAGSGLSTSA